MDLKQVKQLEPRVYDTLKQIFSSGTDDYTDSKKYFCVVPPGILIEILQTLIVPVVTAIIAEFLIRKFMPEKGNRSQEIRQKAEILKAEAEAEINSRSEEILTEDQEASSVVQNISTKLTINITVGSQEDGEKLLSYLERYLNEPEDMQNH